MQPIRYQELGIDYKTAPDWPKDLVPKGQGNEHYEIGGQSLPMHRAYYVEVTARRLKLLDPTQDMDGLRVALADLQYMVYLGFKSKTGKGSLSRLAMGQKAYMLWCTIAGISVRSHFDQDHVQNVIRLVTEGLRQLQADQGYRLSPPLESTQIDGDATRIDATGPDVVGDVPEQ